jgi:diguanylate cyclase (GGDEF)-like protein/putative nucleotidyltransferase with HDIG domain
MTWVTLVSNPRMILMKSLSLLAKTYIIGTILAGCAILGWDVFRLPRLNLEMLLVLSGLASLALIIKVEGATNRLHYNISFILYSFALISYGVQFTMLVILISNIIEWMYRKYPWYIQSFNIASYAIVLKCTGLFYDRISPIHPLASPIDILGVISSMVLFTLLNHLFVGVVIWLARGENFAKSGIFGFLPLMIDFTMLTMGYATALIWQINPVAIILTIIPLYLIYTTLRVPALERQTEIDAKTGVFNARHFANAMEAELIRANRFDRPLTLVMGDLDLLRNINNTYGHLAGDQVLIGVANIMKKHIRDYDILARFGGEEFTILVPEANPVDIFSHVEAIRQAIEEAEFIVPTSVTPISVTMSFGIAGRETFDQTANDIVHNADIALYHAKSKGRNCTYIYSDLDYEGFIPNNDVGQQKTNFTTLENRIQENKYPHQPNPLRDSSERRLPESQKSSKDKQPISKNHHNGSLNHFIGGLVIVSLGLFYILYHPSSEVDWLGLGIFAGIVVLTEWYSIEIHAKSASISTSAAPMAAGVLLYGPLGAAVMSLTFAIVTLIKHKSRINRFFFNASNQMTAGLLFAAPLFFMRISFASLAFLFQLLLAPLYMFLVYILTTGLISVAMSLDMGMPVINAWKEKFSWLTPYYLAMGLIAYALIFSYQNMGVWGLIIILVPLLLLRISQKQYIDHTRGVVNELRENNLILERNGQQINILNEGLLSALSEVIDMRDPFVLGHSKQVTNYAVAIAKKLDLSPEQVEKIRKASLLHDIGKLGVPDRILTKPGTLTQEEYDMVKDHVILGAKILESSLALNSLIPIVEHHHERYDGKGYPEGLKANEIPIEARIISLADAIEAMASDRPYRKSMGISQIMEEVTRCSGTHFDPAVVRAFLDITADEKAKLIVNSARPILLIQQEAVLANP